MRRPRRRSRHPSPPGMCRRLSRSGRLRRRRSLPRHLCRTQPLRPPIRRCTRRHLRRWARRRRRSRREGSSRSGPRPEQSTHGRGARTSHPSVRPGHRRRSRPRRSIPPARSAQSCPRRCGNPPHRAAPLARMPPRSCLAARRSPVPSMPRRDTARRQGRPSRGSVVVRRPMWRSRAHSPSRPRGWRSRLRRSPRARRRREANGRGPLPRSRSRPRRPPSTRLRSDRPRASCRRARRSAHTQSRR